jgi:hypothetical protein
MEFFLFAGLMFIDMLIFIVLALRYKYVNVEHESNGKKTDGLELPENVGGKTNGVRNPGFQDDM